MKIETKLNPLDKIFFIHERKVIESIVQHIRIEIDEDGVFVLYLCNSESQKNVNIKVEEQHAFKTKAELLKSL